MYNYGDGAATPHPHLPTVSPPAPGIPYPIGHSYNKALAWIDVMLEFIVERLYFLVPSLPEILGDLSPNLQVRYDVVIESDIYIFIMSVRECSTVLQRRRWDESLLCFLVLLLSCSP